MANNNIINDGERSPRVILREPTGSTAEVLLYGGQVVSWKNERREELLFMSSKAVSKPPKPMRGGMPICFPQVANFGTLEQHGFARNRLWAVDEDPAPLPPTNNQSMVDLVLKSTEDDLHTWPYRFEFRLRVCVGANKLTMIPRVRNVDCKTFSFTIALRNYFSVSDVRCSGAHRSLGVHISKVSSTSSTPYLSVRLLKGNAK